MHGGNLKLILKDIIIKVYRSSCKVHVILVRLSQNSNIIDSLSKNPQILRKVIKSHPAGAEMFHADRWMDRQT